MTRHITVAAAQLGPNDHDRKAVLDRCIVLMERAAGAGANLVVFPEAALTPFFPHWVVEDEEELDSYFERGMPNANVQPLFDAARRLKIAFHLGYCEIDETAGDKRRFNSAVLVDGNGEVVGKYRKIHLPGYVEPRPEEPFQNLEKRYFAVGDLGFRSWEMLGTRIGMLICNDRRWPEAYRVLGLQRTELVLIGYNTPTTHPAFPESNRLTDFHNHLSMQAGAYQNAMWCVGTAKAGEEAGVAQIGGSCVIAPSGEIVAQAGSLGDELVVHTCDLDLAARYRRNVFDLEVNRRPEHYGPLLPRT